MAVLDALLGLGLTKHQARAYVALVELGEATAYRVATHANLPPANTYAALRALVNVGAARLLPGRPRRFRPQEPDEWAETVLARLRQQADEAVQDLLARSAAPPPEDDHDRHGESARLLLQQQVAGVDRELAVQAPAPTLARWFPTLQSLGRRGVRVFVAATGEALPFDLPAGWFGAPIQLPERPEFESVWVADGSRVVRFAGRGQAARARQLTDRGFARALSDGIVARIAMSLSAQPGAAAQRQRARIDAYFQELAGE